MSISGYLQDAPAHLPVCGIVAVAAAARVPYQKALDTFQEVRPRRSNWKGFSSEIEQFRALEILGARYKKVEVPRKALKHVVGQLNPKGTYMIWIGPKNRGHLIVVKGGKLYDQHNKSGLPVEVYGGDRKIVRQVYRIFPNTKKKDWNKK